MPQPKFSCLLVLAAGALRGQLLTPAWVELGEGGQALVRVVAAAPENCPSMVVDGSARPMALRRPVPEGLRPVCESPLPAGARSASVNGQALILPQPDPSRVVVIGDTGCRIKGARVIACNDPAEWPFEQVAGRAAEARPSLVIHVGDYLYREDTCPAESKNRCGDTPGGDRWEAWNADFFAPAAKLLAAAPWAFARGNHEACARSWRGWFYYLDPRPWNGACETYPAPYLVKLGAFELAMFDSSAVSTDEVNPEQVRKYAALLARVHATDAWLVAHHPFWGIKTDPNGGPSVPLITPLADAWKTASPQGIDLIVSGHVHMFQLLSFDRARPPQLVAGASGADLAAPFPASVTGLNISGASVVESESRREFAFTLLTRNHDGWDLALKSRTNQTLAVCAIRRERAACKR